MADELDLESGYHSLNGNVTRLTVSQARRQARHRTAIDVLVVLTFVMMFFVFAINVSEVAGAVWIYLNYHLKLDGYIAGLQKIYQAALVLISKYT